MFPIKHRILPYVVALSLVLGAAPALAHTVPVGDSNDVASALDLASVAVGHTRRAYTGKIVTFDPYESSILAGAGDLYLDLDLAGTKRFDYYVWIDHSSNGTSAKVFKVGRARSIGRAKVTRPNNKTIAVSIPKSLVRRTKKAAGFGARSRYQQPANAYGESTLATDRTPRGTHRF